MYDFSSFWGGGVPAIRDIIYVFLWHESEAQDLSAHCNKKVTKACKDGRTSRRLQRIAIVVLRKIELLA